MAALAELNQRSGSSTVQFASSGTGKRWKMLQPCKSPCFTALWNELPGVITTYSILYGQRQNHGIKKFLLK
jgi:hypothetical protein